MGFNEDGDGRGVLSGNDLRVWLGTMTRLFTTIGLITKVDAVDALEVFDNRLGVPVPDEARANATAVALSDGRLPALGGTAMCPGKEIRQPPTEPLIKPTYSYEYGRPLPLNARVPGYCPVWYLLCDRTSLSLDRAAAPLAAHAPCAPACSALALFVFPSPAGAPACSALALLSLRLRLRLRLRLQAAAPAPAPAWALRCGSLTHRQTRSRASRDRTTR